ncbi:MAG: hemin-degrading factor [Flavobacteriales bacterium]|jgi:putative hemin transport protein|nr:hemin-degrading factor [Flavobacteriales bacterium]
MNTTVLSNEFATYKEANPKAYLYRAAQDLKVSELDLLALEIGKAATVLNPDFEGILGRLRELGKVMALTRNEYAVHERKGIYKNMNAQHGHIIFVGKDIDLRIFPQSWNSALAVVQETERGTKRSIQFFDKKGLAIHKVFLLPESKIESFDQLVSDFKNETQEVTFVGENPQAIIHEDIDFTEENKLAFQKEWKEITDTHQFFGLYRKYKLHRQQAVENAPDGFAKKLDNEAIKTLFEKFSENKQEIMVFAGNKSIIQIHSGLGENILYRGPWINIMDPDFNLHLNMEGINSLFAVVRPSEDGPIHSIEAYDENKEMIVQFFGKRKPRIPELEGWTGIVKDMMSE